jgi:hypothetical protein
VEKSGSNAALGKGGDEVDQTQKITQETTDLVNVTEGDI